MGGWQGDETKFGEGIIAQCSYQVAESISRDGWALQAAMMPITKESDFKGKQLIWCAKAIGFLRQPAFSYEVLMSLTSVHL